MTRRWLERLVSPAWWPIERKTKKFVTVPRGPHSQDASVPLAVVVRDVLKLAMTAKEARHIIKAGKVLIDGRMHRDPKHGIGPMDLVEIKDVGSWRAVPGKQLTLITTSGADNKLKLCRITGKRNVRGRKLQFNLHDGRSLLADQKWSVGDSLMIETPTQKVIEHFKFEPGVTVLLTSGSRAGTTSRLVKKERDLGRVWLESDGKNFEAPISAAFVVGKEKPAVKLSD